MNGFLVGKLFYFHLFFLKHGSTGTQGNTENLRESLCLCVSVVIFQFNVDFLREFMK